MNNYYPYPQMPMYTQRQEIVKVNGENGARMFQMAPNSSVLLLDETNPIVWLVITDGAGYKTVTPYAISPYQPEPVVDLQTLESRIKKLEDTLNGKSNSRSSKPKQTDGADSSD